MMEVMSNNITDEIKTLPSKPSTIIRRGNKHHSDTFGMISHWFEAAKVEHGVMAYKQNCLLAMQSQEILIKCNQSAKFTSA